VLACHRQEPLPLDRLNVNGGSISLGHPIGAAASPKPTPLAGDPPSRQVGRSRGWPPPLGFPAGPRPAPAARRSPGRRGPQASPRGGPRGSAATCAGE
jgi:hypothetical protein